ncbi:MAG: nucleotidyltransferase domain-containing protein [Deltaproteobacteria bacterium]|nr:nucleotidyltransferase domain-containing protein [Deltaproteobacteria bacterium]
MADEHTEVLTIVTKYLSALKKAGIDLQKAYLYGSYARGTIRKDSDIDIAVISKDFTGIRFDDALKICRYRLDIDLRIEPMPFRPEDFTEENPLAAEIIKYGIELSV